MPVKTVTIQVTALTDRANRDIAATAAYFEKLRAANPVELKVKLDSAQALAEAAVLKRELGGIVSGRIGIPGIPGIPGAPGGPAGALPGAIGAVPTPVLAGGAAAALAVLPFIAQAAATGIITVLGTALVGIGVYAEKGVKSVVTQFTGLQKVISQTFNNLSPAFGAALTTILSAARTFVPQFIRDFKPALDAIAGPLASLGVMIAGSLASPQVAGSLKAVGTAFGAILKAITPTVAGDINAIANGFTAIANSIIKHPQLLADFFVGLTRIVAGSLQVIAALSNVAGWIESHWQWAKWFIIPEATVIAFTVSHFIPFFTRQLPAAFDILKESVRIAFNEIAMGGLHAALTISTAFGHLPGFIGAPFRAASALIRGELASIEGSTSNAVANIKNDWARLNGTSANLYVYTNFVNVGTPPTVGGIYPTPSGLPPGVRRYAGGAAFAAPGWAWVGERGPELAYLTGGETIIPASAARGYAAGAGPLGGGIEARLDDLIDAVDTVTAAIGTLTGVTASTPAALGAAMTMGGRAAAYGALYP